MFRRIFSTRAFSKRTDTLSTNALQIQELRKGVLRGIFFKNERSLLAVALEVPNLLVGPISLGIFLFSWE